MDGSSAHFVEAIDEVGLRSLDAPRKYIKVLKPIRVDEGDCWGELSPHSGFHVDVEIEFDSPVIGRQQNVANAQCFGTRRHGHVDAAAGHGRVLLRDDPARAENGRLLRMG